MNDFADQWKKARTWLSQGELALAAPLYEQLLQVRPEQAELWHEQGLLLAQQGQWPEAIHSLTQAVEKQPTHEEFLLPLLRLLRQEKEYSRALELLNPALSTASARLWFQKGLLHQEIQQPEAAREAYEQALRLNPHYAQAWNNLGNVARQEQDLPTACHCYQQALERQANYPEAWHNLGLCHEQQQQWLKALHCYQKLTTWVPPSAPLWLRQGQLWRELGDSSKATEAFEQALALNPADAEIHNELGLLYKRGYQLSKAIEHYRQSLELNPNQPDTWLNLALTWQDQGNTVEADQCLERSQKLVYRPGIALLQATLLPAIYSSQQALDHWRERYQTRLTALAQAPLNIPDPLQEIYDAPFALAYQGYSNHELMALTAQVYGQFLPVEHPWTPHPEDQRIRLGVVSRYLYGHSVLHYFRQLFLSLDPAEFNVFLFAAPGSPQDQVTDELRQHSGHFAELPPDLAISRQQIADCQLDIVLYPEIGSERFCYLMALTRLAPVQCVLLGHPMTSGIPTMDYYLSSAAIETPESAAFYSEKLVALPGLPTHYTEPVVPPLSKSRADFGLLEREHLYLCPATLFKMHPDYDRALAGILQQDPLARLVFFADHSQPFHEHLQQRWEKVLDIQRVTFLPWQSPANFMQLLQLADAGLDSFYFGGGNTAFITMAAGLPTVTWPAPFARGRMYAAHYALMGMGPGLVAETQENYANLAVAMGQDKDLQNELKQQILNRKAVLYSDMTGTQAMVDFFRQVGQRQGG